MHRSSPGSALLSPADSQARARNLHCWSAAQRSKILTTVLALFALWKADWGLAENDQPPASSLPLSDADACQQVHCQLFGSTSGPSAATHPESTSIAHTLSNEAWSDWLARLRYALPNAPDAAANTTPGFRTGKAVNPAPAWEGHIDIALPWWSGLWMLQIDRAVVQHILGMQATQSPASILYPKVKLVAITTALATQTLEVSAQLPPISLSLGQIESLCVGDIIPLPLRLDEPATLQVQTGTAHVLCAAWLGQQQGRMAAELSIQSPSPT